MVEESASREEVNSSHLAIMETIVDKARSEPQWREKLISDPPTAFREAGIVADDFDPANAEVVGQSSSVEYSSLLWSVWIAMTRSG